VESFQNYWKLVERHWLIAALNWGLGHATRMVPVIRYAQDRGVHITLAGDGAVLAVWRDAFPELPQLELPGYGISYQAKGPFWLWMAVQMPQIANAVAAERKMVSEWIAQHPTDAIISDNRYGVCHPEVHSVLISHQLSPFMPKGMGWAGPFVRGRLDRHIRQFNEWWVPDRDDDSALVPALWQRSPFAGKASTIGWLSRLEPGSPSGPPLDLLVLLSGPEPQRNMMEAKLLAELKHFTGTWLMAGGRPGTASSDPRLVPYLTPDALSESLTTARCVIARTGYSTVMELLRFRKKAILIPTPGQTEQEYLGEVLHDKGLYLVRRQKGFRLLEAMDQVRGFQPDFQDVSDGDFTQYTTAIDRLLKV
jgi:hypothetical protein